MELESTEFTVAPVWANISSTRQSSKFVAVFVVPCRKHCTDWNAKITIGNREVDSEEAERILLNAIKPTPDAANPDEAFWTHVKVRQVSEI